jgi:low temperature requirement protein LtrA
LYDLTFAVAFAVAGEQLAHLLAEGHFAAGLIGFVVAVFAVCWCWINYSWFASAYDTTTGRSGGDDGADGRRDHSGTGASPVFHSIDAGHTINNSVTVAGYVVMRVSMIFLWLRAARQDPPRCRTCQTYVVTIGVAQLGWITLLLAHTTVGVFVVWAVILILIEWPVRSLPSAARAAHRGTPTILPSDTDC